MTHLSVADSSVAHLSAAEAIRAVFAGAAITGQLRVQPAPAPGSAPAGPSSGGTAAGPPGRSGQLRIVHRADSSRHSERSKGSVRSKR